MEHHNHSHRKGGTSSAIAFAFFLNLGFTLFEIVGGLWTNSLAILSDALHDLGDSLSLGISWMLERYSHKKTDKRYSYGYRRYSLLAALINTIVLITGSVIIINEALPRLFDPQGVDAQGMALISVVGIVINGLAVLRVRGETGLNARVVAVHLLEDVLGWVAVLIVSLILLIWDLPILDPLLSLAITAFVLFNILKVLKQTLALFLQAVPEQINVGDIEQKILDMDEVESVHHTHVWSLDGENHVLTTHIVVSDCATRENITQLKSTINSLSHHLGMAHTTIEIEYEKSDCSMLGSD